MEGFDQSKIAPQVKEKDNDLEWFIKLITVRLTDPNHANVRDLRDLFDDESEYDLVFLNFRDGTADIKKNAECFMEVVRQVNLRKAEAGSTEPNVVLGLSMGGLVTRYGLAKMVKIHGENPQVRVLASYDSPHRGANIPLGFQAMMHQLNELHILPFIKLGYIQPRVPQAVATVRSPAAQQMLLQQATNGNDGTAPNTFIEGEYRQMVTGFVMPYKFITLSAGAECAQRNHEPNAMLMDTNLEFGLLKGNGIHRK